MSNKPVSEDIPAEEDVIFDLSTSCTKDQAVMRMLGWGKDVVYRRTVPISEEGFSPEDIKQAHPKFMTLEERLSDLSEHARRALIDAAENDASFDVISQLNEGVLEVRRLIVNARDFRSDIDDELSKGAQSILRVDEALTISSGVTHLNIRSIDKWISKAYGAESKVLHAIGNEPVNDRSHKKSKAENSVYITLAIAVTAFAQNAGGKYLKSGVTEDQVQDTSDMNMSEIYTHLESIASKQVKGKEFPGQSESSLKATIVLAFEIKRNAVNNLN